MSVLVASSADNKGDDSTIGHIRTEVLKIYRKQFI